MSSAEQRLPREAKWIAEGGLARKAAWEARRARVEKESDSTSVASCSTASSFRVRSSAVAPKLSELEEREARKHDKSLHEISRIEKMIASGKQVDALQVRKAQRRAEIEATVVMWKVRAGYARAC